ncbi:MAG: ABC transporter ATP-binding protein [Leptolyngbyaceae cyanobacterium]
MLIVENVSKSFAGLRAVDDCSLHVSSRSITGIIGPNGAGKSTLFNIIAGFLKPTSGRVLLGDRDITAMAAHQRFHYGLVRTFQIPREFGRMTVLENLLLVPPQQLGENLLMSWLRWQRVLAQEQNLQHKAQEVLSWLNLSHLQDELAQGLSGGQKKLLELGRALMVDPQIILLDEPAAGVNRTLLRELTDIIQRLNTEQGCTVCLIDHDLDMVGNLCDRVIVMAQGSVLAEGTMDSIRQHPEVQAAYLGNLPSVV